MQSNYIAKFSDGRIVALYHNESGIVARVCENGRWLAAITLLKGAQTAFSANFALSDELQIYAQDEKGSVVLISFNGDNISLRTILENRSNDIHTILFSPIGSGRHMSLLYNIPHKEGGQKLIVQKLHENGNWDNPQEIAMFAPQADNIFEILRINENHGLVFYRREGSISGYREITADRVGEFVSVQRQAENMQSYSFFVLGECLHTVYLSSNLFASRLIYRRKISDSFEAPILLWEGQWLENCLICEINGATCVFFQSGGSLYMTKSTDNGQSFSKPENYKHKFCRLPKKAIYISGYPNDSFNAHHVFVDDAHPWDIQILPDMCHNFYPYHEKKQEAPKEPEPLAQEDIARMELIQERMKKLTAQNQEQSAQIAQMIQIIAEYEEKEKNSSSSQLAQNLEIIRKKDEEIAQYQQRLLAVEAINIAAENAISDEDEQDNLQESDYNN